MDPRDFLYVKRIDRKDENNCIEISKSIQIEGFQPKYDNMINQNSFNKINNKGFIIIEWEPCLIN